MTLQIVLVLCVLGFLFIFLPLFLFIGMKVAYRLGFWLGETFTSFAVNLLSFLT